MKFCDYFLQVWRAFIKRWQAGSSVVERTEPLDVGAREIAAVQFVDAGVFYKLFVRTYDILSFL